MRVVDVALGVSAVLLLHAGFSAVHCEQLSSYLPHAGVYATRQAVRLELSATTHSRHTATVNSFAVKDIVEQRYGDVKAPLPLDVRKHAMPVHAWRAGQLRWLPLITYRLWLTTGGCWPTLNLQVYIETLIGLLGIVAGVFMVLDDFKAIYSSGGHPLRSACAADLASTVRVISKSCQALCRSPLTVACTVRSSVPIAAHSTISSRLG